MTFRSFALSPFFFYAFMGIFYAAIREDKGKSTSLHEKTISESLSYIEKKEAIPPSLQDALKKTEAHYQAILIDTKTDHTEKYLAHFHLGKLLYALGSTCADPIEKIKFLQAANDSLTKTLRIGMKVEKEIDKEVEAKAWQKKILFEVADVHYIRGCRLIEINEWQQAIHSLQKARKIYETLGKKGKGKGSESSIKKVRAKSIYKEAIKKRVAAIEGIDSVDTILKIAKTDLAMGRARHKQKKYDLARVNYIAAAEIGKKAAKKITKKRDKVDKIETILIAPSYRLAGDICQQQEKYDEASEFYKKSLRYDTTKKIFAKLIVSLALTDRADQDEEVLRLSHADTLSRQLTAEEADEILEDLESYTKLAKKRHSMRKESTEKYRIPSKKAVDKPERSRRGSFIRVYV